MDVGNASDGIQHAPVDGPASQSRGLPPRKESITTADSLDNLPPGSPMIAGNSLPRRQRTTVNVNHYFTGPRDMTKHSKWPQFMRLHGSILPKMIVPLLCISLWSTFITLLSKLVDNVDLGIDSILLTVTGIVVGFSLSFRTSTAYERYAEGRKSWSTLQMTCQALTRVYWIHARSRAECAKEDLLRKVSVLNLIAAFTIALKHKLRFEPYTHYDDLAHFTSHLETFAQDATITDDKVRRPKGPGLPKLIGSNLGLAFAESNPRKAIKKAEKPLGNLPLEILTYLAAYTDEIAHNGQLVVPMTQATAYNSINALSEVLTSTERILTTPMPLAFLISITQITLVYVFLLPFQLLPSLGWITIPAAVCASYIILGILYIGEELENPFGRDVNDLPLDLYCAQIVEEIETVTARPPPAVDQWAASPKNELFFPYNDLPYTFWLRQSEASIRHLLRQRPQLSFDAQRAAATGCGFTNSTTALTGVTKREGNMERCGGMV